MSPVVPIKSYSRKSSILHKGSVQAVDALFIKNICKRKETEIKLKSRRKPIKITDLTPLDENHYLLEESFLDHFNQNDTFDNLFKANLQNNISCKVLLKNNSNLKSELSNNTENLLVKEQTMDKTVNVSLFIEKMIKNHNLSNGTLSGLSQGQSKSSNLLSTQTNIRGTLDQSIFTGPFKNCICDVKIHISGTPHIRNNRPHSSNLHLHDTMSPSLKPECKSVLEESYEEVMEWNHTPPKSFNFLSNRIKKPTLIHKHKMMRKNEPKQHEKKFSSLPTQAYAVVVKKQLDQNLLKSDWKLHAQSKIILDNTLDILGIQQSVSIKKINDFEALTSKDIDKNMKQSINNSTLYNSSFQKPNSYELRTRSVAIKHNKLSKSKQRSKTPISTAFEKPSFISDHTYCKILIEDCQDDIISKRSKEESTKHQISVNINKSKKHQEQETFKTYRKTRNPIILSSGKSWRRSLLELRRKLLSNSVGSRCSCDKCGSTHLQKTSGSDSFDVSHLSIIYQRRNNFTENHFATNLYNSYVSDNTQEENTGSIVYKPIYDSLYICSREIVLQRCRQQFPLRFEDCYSADLLQNCLKIGEGVYGEVFLYKSPEQIASVIKVIPIEGVELVNGQHQKTFAEISSEIIIAMELSNLRNGTQNRTDRFCEVKQVQCVQGGYPEQLLRLWDLYDATYGTENDSPEMFKFDQMYIVLEFTNGGKDMESYQFKNSIQAEALFKQIACALAVAECSLEFEHRDLHWGNILISNTEKSTISFSLNNREFEIDTCGIAATIIDFTLSRIKYKDGFIYNDLSEDPDLFTATGDYQFEVYKLMQEKNRNNWQVFNPTTNLLWLHYVLDKMITALRYKHCKSKLHKNCITKLEILKNRILNYKTVTDVVLKEILS